LSAAKTKALKAACLNNMKQMGVATFIYSGDNSENMATPEYTGSPADPNPWHTYDLVTSSGTADAAVPVPFTQPINHGLYHTSKIITSGKSYYCPGLNTAIPTQLKYAYESYSHNNLWPSYCQATPPGFTANGGTAWGARLRSSYMYYPCSRNYINPANTKQGYIVAKKTTELSADHVLMTDLLYDWDALAHRTGNAPKALNILWGDGHVFASTAPQLFTSFAKQNYWGSDINGIAYAGNVPAQFSAIVSLLTP
jgi:prepilin-type processing-associated H-X9-DG protein